MRWRLLPPADPQKKGIRDQPETKLPGRRPSHESWWPSLRRTSNRNISPTSRFSKTTTRRPRSSSSRYPPQLPPLRHGHSAHCEQTTTDRNPPPGFEFVPIGNPELTKACKELSREQEAMIFIVCVRHIQRCYSLHAGPCLTIERNNRRPRMSTPTTSPFK